MLEVFFFELTYTVSEARGGLKIVNLAGQRIHGFNVILGETKASLIV